MNSVACFLAWRYLKGTYNQKNVAAMVYVSFLSIFVGTFSLALIVSIMNGFEKATLSKLQSIHSHIIMHADSGYLNEKKILAALKNNFPAIKAASPSARSYAIIQSKHIQDFSTIVTLNGIDPVKEKKMGRLEEKLFTIDQKATRSLPALLEENTILLGKKLANNLHVVPGDTIVILYSEDNESSKKKSAFSQHSVIVSGTFSTGIEEFDAQFAFCSFELFEELWPNIGTEQINIMLEQQTNEKEVIEQLRSYFNLDVYSWKELYPAIVSALKLEKYTMFFILILICLVASTTIISLLFMLITQKRHDIALLQTMGMSHHSLRSMFLIIGMSITACATLAGIFFSFLIGLFLQHYPFIELPDIYYLSHLPIQMELKLFILIFFIVMFLSFCALWFPTRRIAAINIAHILRFEL